MAADDEKSKAWKLILRMDVLLDEPKTKKFIDKYVIARGKRKNEEISAIRNYLTPPAKGVAIVWQRTVINEAWRAFKANQEITFSELLDCVMKLPDLPGQETVQRFLNGKGFNGKPGRPSKKSNKINKMGRS